MNQEPQTPQKESKEIEDNFSTIKEWQENGAASAARRLNSQQDQNDSSLTDVDSEPGTNHILRNRLITTALVATAAFGVAGLAAEHGGGSNGENRGTVDTTIEAVTLNPDANIRFDPYVGQGENDNTVLHLGAQITIEVNHDVRVLDGTNKGTWIGVPLAEVKTVVPDINTSDKDGIVWINEEGIQSIKHTDLATK